MTFIRVLLSVSFFFIANLTFAVEGMWLPLMLQKYTIEQMQATGFKLSAQDIYDINEASLSDAVVGLVRVNNPFHHFCTGELISVNGLMLTNHHCGYGYIQKHSSVENDLLKDGFWAMCYQDELPNDGLGVCFLKRMQEVTEQVLIHITDSIDAFTRDSILTANIAAIENKAVEGTHYLAKVKPFFAGNEYYLSVYELFTDVRLVGAPPSAIGKFGGDTDNWMWPRHTGDFSMFRIYCDTNNQPANFSQSNVPYHPKKHLEISLSGVKNRDFTMVMGYPGTTEEYLPSFALQLQTEVVNLACISIRAKAIDIIKTEMDKSAETRIKYAAKVASLANGWKKWQGENIGLKRMDAIKQKQKQERLFTLWVNSDSMRILKYGNILSNYEKLYNDLHNYQLGYTYFVEAVLGSEILDFARSFNKLAALSAQSDTTGLNAMVKELIQKTEAHFKDVDSETDRNLYLALMNLYYTDLDTYFYPKQFAEITKKYKGSTQAYFLHIYNKSIFNDELATKLLLHNFKVTHAKKLLNDPILMLYNQLLGVYYQNIRPFIVPIYDELETLHKVYMQALLEYNVDKRFYPDANSTFRIAYGQVDTYFPRDAVTYNYYTTLDGIIAKDNPDIYDYHVPERLKELYKEKDFGIYANSDTTMPVCFIASNHTTGGNSGSPLFNAYGQLIGINFDRNWEGTMSDLMYDPNMCRNIALDIRYVLFIIDKYAGATHLIDEMTLVKSD